MPGGPTPLGFVYFAGVKFVGYSGYAALINRSKAVSRSGNSTPAAWKGGLVRTGIGVIVGVVVGLAFWKGLQHLPNTKFLDDYGTALFFVFLVPVRILEWYVFLRLMYRRCEFSPKTNTIFVSSGIAVSFLMDVIGFFAVLVIPGGAWIC